MGWTVSSLIMTPLAMLAIFSSVPPLIIYMRAKNLPASVLILGIAIFNVQNLVNATVWHSADVSEWWDGRILCDIEVKLYYGVIQAIDGAIASLFRQIAVILHPDYAATAPSPRQRSMVWIFELILCIFLPLYVMVGHYLTQRSRYWIRASAGCIPTYDNNYAAPFLTYLWPSAVSLIGSTYCLVSIVRLYRHRQQMSSVFSTAPGVSHSRFFRLLVLTLTLLAIFLPISIFSFVQNVRIPMHRYAWSHIHPPDWSNRIFLNVRGPLDVQISPDRWAHVVSAYFSFASCGLGHEATQMYRGWVLQIRRLLGIQPRATRQPLEQRPVALESIETQVDTSARSSVGDAIPDDPSTLPHHSHMSELSA